MGGQEAQPSTFSQWHCVCVVTWSEPIHCRSPYAFAHEFPSCAVLTEWVGRGWEFPECGCWRVHFQFLSARLAGSHAYKLLLGYSCPFTLVAENSRYHYLCPPNLLLTLLRGRTGRCREVGVSRPPVCEGIPAPLAFLPPS